MGLWWGDASATTTKNVFDGLHLKLKIPSLGVA